VLGAAGDPPGARWGPPHLEEAAGGQGAVALVLRPHVGGRQAEAAAVHLLPEAQRRHLHPRGHPAVTASPGITPADPTQPRRRPPRGGCRDSSGSSAPAPGTAPSPPAPSRRRPSASAAPRSPAVAALRRIPRDPPPPWDLLPQLLTPPSRSPAPCGSSR